MRECHFYHHVVDLLDGQAQLAGLEACGDVRLEHCLDIDTLVEVVASDLWYVPWEVTTGLQHGLHGDRGGLVCHLLCKNKQNLLVD